MYIHQLIQNKEEYWKLAWPLIDWAGDCRRSLWREEDYPKLMPFFNEQAKMHSGMAWTPAVIESFDFYKKCCEEYGDARKELRDAVSQFTPEDIIDAFGFNLPEDEDEYGEHLPLTLADDFDTAFPFIVVGDVDSGFDRLGKIRFIGLYRVALDEFKV